MWVIQHPETVTPLWTTGRCLSENLDGMDISGCVRVLVSGFVGWLVVLDGMHLSGCVRVLVSGFLGWLVVLDDMDISGCVCFSL